MTRAASWLLIALVTLTGALITLTASPASAHTDLESSTPSSGGTATSPTKVDLVFGGKVQQGLADIKVIHDATGTRADSGKPTHPAPTSLSVALKDVQEGAYTVNWSVIAEDGHRLTGKFAFTAEVEQSTTTTTAAAGGTAKPVAPWDSGTTATTMVSASPVSDTSGSQNRGLMLAGFGLVGVISLVVAFLALRPRY